MRHEGVKDGLRKEIAKRSVEVLRSHGLNDDAIKAEMAKDFSLSGPQVEELLSEERRK